MRALVADWVRWPAARRPAAARSAWPALPAVLARSLERPAQGSSDRATWSRLSGELAERLDEPPRAVAIPPVQVSDFLELLPALSWNQEELGAGLGQRCHVTPKLLELGDGEDILLRVPPAPLDLLDGDVCRQPSGERAHGLKHALRIVQGAAGKPKQGQEWVHGDPGRKRVVVGQPGFVLLAR